ncbi:hypothetical protein FQA39_LY15380 [Lamprigera yunnana]|nr:hypothetical protein FQA39_LY15380 [Lamprigera yunnana]
MLVVVICGVFVCLVLQWYTKYRRLVKAMECFPGAPTIPLIGNALDFKSGTDFIPRLAEYRKLYGDVIKVYIGIKPAIVVISDIKLIEQILKSTKNLDKGSEYGFLSRWLGNGLLISKGDFRWKTHRKLIGPSFNMLKLEQFIEIFDSNTYALVNKLKKEIGKPYFDVFNYISLCALDIIYEAAMGTSIQAQDNANSDYFAAVKTMCHTIVIRAFNPLLKNDYLYFLSSQFQKEKRAVKILHQHTNKLIERKKKEREFDVVKNIDETIGKRRTTFLDLLLEHNANGQIWTDAEMREEVDTFVFAGHDTTAVAVTFAILCLAENPEVQGKVIKELDEILGKDKDKNITLQNIQSMTYLDAVIKEVLRLYPPVPYYLRRVTEAFEFEGRVIPEGITLLINIYGIHHHPHLYHDPERCVPERFLNKDNENIPKYGYLPFSYGLRNCIGQKFAVLEMKTILSILLRHYEFLTTVPRHEVVLSAQTVLTSHNGVRVRVVERN